MLERTLLPGEYAVLGMLALRPMHGYEMARFFDRDELSDVCPIEQSLLYTYIRNVEERALVTFHEERIGQRPPRKCYVLSEAGRSLLDRWLHQPVERMREVRLEFLLKLYFLHQLDVDGERDLLRREIEVCEAYRSRLADRANDNEGFRRLVALSKVSAAESVGNWLRAYATELSSVPTIAAVRP